MARCTRSATVERTLGPGDILEGKWKLLSLLGQGGMGKVFLAEDLTLPRSVAVKILDEALLAGDPAFRGRFEREAKLLARVDHPNVVSIYAVGSHEERPFLVMKYLQGELLSARLDRAGSGLPAGELLPLARQVATALDYVHAQGFIHRDVKPANLMVAREGTVTLLDFGVTRDLGSLTQTRDQAGSAAYMAPEQLEGTPYDHRSDLYAFGVVLFEMVTGKRPFVGQSDATVAYLQVHGPVPRAEALDARVSPAVSAVLARALAKKPEERYASAAELVSALAEALGGGRAGAGKRRGGLGLVMVGGVALAASWGAFAVWRHRAPATVASLPPKVSVPPAPVSSVPPVLEPPSPKPAPVEHLAPAATPKPPAAASTRVVRHPGATARAELRVVTSEGGQPTWASVYVDGAYAGGAPLTLKLVRGAHVIRVERPGFSTTVHNVHVKESGSQLLKVELRP